jgi:ubiquinone/menaquinone biosynthesis C-methylase UbiE
MSSERKNLGDCNEIAAILQVFPLAGVRALDIGCGPGKIARDLIAAGATVTGIEPDPVQAEKNRKQEPVPGLTFIEARAEKLPIADASVDAVFFFRSLHHVPVESMDAALGEACRAVKHGGRVVVLEPGMDGTHFAVQKNYNDETRVRTLAQQALVRTTPKLFGEGELYTFMMRPTYPNFETLVERVTGQTFNNIKRDKVETEEVRALFEKAKTPNGDYAFTQPMLMNVYVKA